MDAQLVISQRSLSPCSLALVEAQTIGGEANRQSPSIFVEKDWIEQRALISSMYVRDDMTLENIRRFMETNHGLRATKKMFKDRLSAWGVSKNLRDDEIVNLMRIKVSRDAVGKQIMFLRYGTLISSRRLDRRLREKQHLWQKVLQQGSSETDIDDLLQNYLPSRGLVALECHPSAGLRGDEMLHITESSIFSLRVIGESDTRWCFKRTPKSPWLLYAALFDRDPMAQAKVERKHAWMFIEEACNTMSQDIAEAPDEIALQLLWVMSKNNVAGKQPLLGYQLMRHASQLFALSFGPKHPYSILFAAAASMTYSITSYGYFRGCLIEVLTDVVMKKLRALFYRHKPCERHRSMHEKSRNAWKTVRKLRATGSELSESDSREALHTLVLLQEDTEHADDPRQSSFEFLTHISINRSLAANIGPEETVSDHVHEVVTSAGFNIYRDPGGTISYDDWKETSVQLVLFKYY